MASNAETTARQRLASNGRNPANKNAGIRTGSDLHLCEMLLKEMDAMRRALKPFADMAGPLKGEEGRPSEIEIIDKDGTGELYVASHFGSSRYHAAIDADDFHTARAAYLGEGA